jgi:Holliday junction resolvase
MRWQDFERTVKSICDENGFKTSFRVVFKDEHGRGEIDVVAERYDITLCIDAKLYSASRYRVSQIKKEAEKHLERCKRFSKLRRKKVVPVIVSLINDEIYRHGECIVVPFESFNDFLTNLHYYLAEFGHI